MFPPSDWCLTATSSRGRVITFPLNALEAMDPLTGLKRAKRIAAHTSFFKSGVCAGRTLVCVVKTSPLSSTIKIFVPNDQNVRGRNKPSFRRLPQGENDTLIYKAFYIPVQSSSIHFLRTKLCVACVNGFEIIDPGHAGHAGPARPERRVLRLCTAERRQHVAEACGDLPYREQRVLLCYDGVCFLRHGGKNHSRTELTRVALQSSRSISTAADIGHGRTFWSIERERQQALVSLRADLHSVTSCAATLAHLSIPIHPRACFRADIRRDPQRRDGLDVAGDSGQ